jgi:SAM-dependent methyltransferase
MSEMIPTKEMPQENAPEVESFPIPEVVRPPAAPSPRWGQDLTSQIPYAKSQNAYCLEYGCGNGAARPVIESYGYHWFGIDMFGNSMSARCDGHKLPFADEQFEFIISIAVFEHLYDPFQAAREVYRVLKPGGTFLGTTAFLEPFHANSYFHMSHMGVQQVLTCAGFKVEHLWPTWHYLEALAGFWAPPQAGPLYTVISKSARFVAKGIMAARAQGLRAYGSARHWKPEDIEKRVERESLTWTGSIGFRAQKVEGNSHYG